VVEIIKSNQAVTKTDHADGKKKAVFTLSGTASRGGDLCGSWGGRVSQGGTVEKEGVHYYGKLRKALKYYVPRLEGITLTPRGLSQFGTLLCEVFIAKGKRDLWFPGREGENGRAEKGVDPEYASVHKEIIRFVVSKRGTTAP